MPFPVDIKYVNDAEGKLGAKFPASFVEHIVRSNGGEISTADDSWELYPILDASDRKRLARTCNDIVRETEQAKKWPTFPSHAVAIGSNGCGDQLVLLPRPDRPDCWSHEVYWWDHETGNLHKTADDFKELI